MTRTHLKRQEDREASKTVLLNRCRRITHILAGIPTGGDAWTVDDHREHVFGADRRATPGPTITDERRAELLADFAAGRACRAPTPAESSAWSEWAEAQPTPERSSVMADCLPASYGVDPGDRITHQRIADQAAKAVAALESCGHWRGVYSCPKHGKWASTARCGHRLCVPCAVHRRAELLKKYGPWLGRNRPDQVERSELVPMVTVTQPSKEGELLGEAFDRLTKRHKAFTRAVTDELGGRSTLAKHPHGCNVGGLTNLEATPRPGRRWNAHAHILLREPEHVPDEWTVPGRRARPLDPWRFRLLWAAALFDGRKTADRDSLAALRRAYASGRAAWLRKQRARKHKAKAGAIESARLKEWAAVCRALDVPSIVDVRKVHPAEGVKYVTKGFSFSGGWEKYRDAQGRERFRKANPVTDWHLWQLLTGTYYLRRTIPWGSLYRLPTVDQAEEGHDHDDDHANCPLCGARSAPVPRDQWSGAVTDTKLVGFKLDRKPFRPRGPPVVVPEQPPPLRPELRDAPGGRALAAALDLPQWDPRAA